MKKSVTIIVLVSLLVGVLATVTTSRVRGYEESSAAQNCGASFNSQTGQTTKLRYCLLSTYGWPVKYTTSGVDAILRDFHTIVPDSPSNASSFITYTSFSRSRFVDDWVFWSIDAGIVLTGTYFILVKQQQPKKQSPKPTKKRRLSKRA